MAERLAQPGHSCKPIRVRRDCRIGETTVRGCIRRAELAGLSWPLSDTLTDAALEQMLYPGNLKIHVDERPVPNWPEVHKQLKRKGVTLQLLVEEFRLSNPNAYG